MKNIMIAIGYIFVIFVAIALFAYGTKQIQGLTNQNSSCSVEQMAKSLVKDKNLTYTQIQGEELHSKTLLVEGPTGIDIQEEDIASVYEFKNTSGDVVFNIVEFNTEDGYTNFVKTTSPLLPEINLDYAISDPNDLVYIGNKVLNTFEEYNEFLNGLNCE